MARHKRIQTEEQSEPEMEISSMIDCCFLLLIYFLVATSLVSEKKLDISIPSSERSASSEKPPVDPGKISVNADGSIMFGDGASALQVADAYNPEAEPGTSEYRAQRNLEVLVENLSELKRNAEAVQAEPIVMLQGASATPHQRIVDVMAALAAAGIHSVGISTGDPE